RSGDRCREGSRGSGHAQAQGRRGKSGGRSAHGRDPAAARRRRGGSSRSEGSRDEGGRGRRTRAGGWRATRLSFGGASRVSRSFALRPPATLCFGSSSTPVVRKIRSRSLL